MYSAFHMILRDAHMLEKECYSSFPCHAIDHPYPPASMSHVTLSTLMCTSTTSGTKYVTRQLGT